LTRSCDDGKQQSISNHHSPINSLVVPAGIELAVVKRGGEMHPITPWIVATLTILAWHIPAAFEMAQQSPSWHWIQRATFFATGLLFWWPVVRPWSTVALPRFAIPLYLFAATLPCDALSAFLVFCDRVVYRRYVAAPHVVTSALEDQQAAGAFMWVSITLIYILPAIVLTVRALSPARQRGENRRTDTSSTWSRATAQP
jgi:cytochrome c oxidase assembly factor CtaG